MGVRGSVAVLTIGMVMVAGCSGGSEQPPASVAPSSAQTTPSASSSPNPSQDPLYLEAVGVYKAYFKEMQKFEAAQYPSDTLPKEMDKYIEGSLKNAVQQGVVKSRQDGMVPGKGQFSKLLEIGPNSGVSRYGSITSIRICVDSRDLDVVDPVTQEAKGQGVLAYKEIFFHRKNDRLLAFNVQAKKVESCPI